MSHHPPQRAHGSLLAQGRQISAHIAVAGRGQRADVILAQVVVDLRQFHSALQNKKQKAIRKRSKRPAGHVRGMMGSDRCLVLCQFSFLRNLHVERSPIDCSRLVFAFLSFVLCDFIRVQDKSPSDRTDGTRTCCCAHKGHMPEYLEAACRGGHADFQLAVKATRSAQCGVHCIHPICCRQNDDPISAWSANKLHHFRTSFRVQGF